MIFKAIQASVGMHASGTKPCYNLLKDKQSITELLNLISGEQGGQKDTPLSPQTSSARTLFDAIRRFQQRQNEVSGQPSLSVDGHVDPNGATLRRLNEVFARENGRGGNTPDVSIQPSDLQLLVQQTNTLGGFTHRPYFTRAESLLRDFGLGVNIDDRRHPEVEFSQLVDVSNDGNKSDITQARLAAEKHTPGLQNLLRVIFCRFDGNSHRFFGVTDGGAVPLEGGLRVPNFILISVGRRAPNDNVLIHEMIHATGLVGHDADPTSVFADGAVGTELKAEHAERLSRSFFARVR